MTSRPLLTQSDAGQALACVTGVAAILMPKDIVNVEQLQFPLRISQGVQISFRSVKHNNITNCVGGGLGHYQLLK